MTHTDSIPSQRRIKIRYLSDLHMEFTRYLPNLVASAGEDIVVLAGDIGTGTAGIHWAKQTFPHTPVLYVLGNHEFYGYDWIDLIREARAACEGSNVSLLENDSFRFNGLRFLGATLWTNFRLGGPGAIEHAMQECQWYVNDYRHIRNQGRALIARESIARHEESLAWLKSELDASDEPTVVITHHGPCLAAEHPRYLLDVYSNCFLSNLPDSLFKKPVAWIYGHTHSNLARPYKGTWLCANQRGYPEEDVPGPRFSWTRVLEIDLGSTTRPASVREVDDAS